MRALLNRLAVGIGLALLSTATLAAELEDAQAFVGKAGLYALVLIMIVAGFCVFFPPSRDKREAPLRSVLNTIDTIHGVEGDVLVVQCARETSDQKIGTLVVMDGEKLIGVFIERGAVNAAKQSRHLPMVERGRAVQELV